MTQQETAAPAIERLVHPELSKCWQASLVLGVTVSLWSVAEEKAGTLLVKRCARYIGYRIPRGHKMHDALTARPMGQVEDELIDRIGAALSAYFKDDEKNA